MTNQQRLSQKFSRNVAAHTIMRPLYLSDDSISPLQVSYPVISDREIAVSIHFFKVIVLEDTRGVLTQKAYILPTLAFQSDKSFEGFAETLENVE